MRGGTMKTFTVNENDAGQRLDKFLSKCTEGMPKSLLYKYIRKKRVKVNGGRAHEGDLLSPGDTVELWIPDEFFRDGRGRAGGGRAGPGHGLGRAADRGEAACVRSSSGRRGLCSS